MSPLFLSSFLTYRVDVGQGVGDRCLGGSNDEVDEDLEEPTQRPFHQGRRKAGVQVDLSGNRYVHHLFVLGRRRRRRRKVGG